MPRHDLTPAPSATEAVKKLLCLRCRGTGNQNPQPWRSLRDEDNPAQICSKCQGTGSPVTIAQTLAAIRQWIYELPTIGRPILFASRVCSIAAGCALFIGMIGILWACIFVLALPFWLVGVAYLPWPDPNWMNWFTVAGSVGFIATVVSAWRVPRWWNDRVTVENGIRAALTLCFLGRDLLRHLVGDVFR